MTQPCGGTSSSVSVCSGGAPLPAMTVAAAGSRTGTGVSDTLSATTRESSPQRVSYA